MTTIRVFSIFALLTIADLTQSRRLPRKLKANISTLQMVQLVFRNGDRSPVFQYPNDPHKNITFWYRYADGFGSLTKKGRKVHHRVGQYWRFRYQGFVNPGYSPKEIYVRSSDTDRSIMSCLANLAGMWPPAVTDPRSNWSSQLQWQPIPIRTVPKHLDNYINFVANCPRFEELHQEFTKKSPFAVAINKKNKELFERLTHSSGLEITDFETAYKLYDTLMIQKSYGQTPPKWLNSTTFKRLKKLAPLPFDSRVMVPTDEAKRVKGGPLLNHIVKNMDVRRNDSTLTKRDKETHPNAKVHMFSGHAETVSILLGTVGVFDPQYPAYASTVILELHKIDKEHYVRVFFRNETIATAAPYEFEIPKCGHPCKLNKFKEIFKHLIVDDKEWEDVCKSGGESISAAASTITTTVPEMKGKGTAPTVPASPTTGAPAHDSISAASINTTAAVPNETSANAHPNAAPAHEITATAPPSTASRGPESTAPTVPASPTTGAPAHNSISAASINTTAAVQNETSANAHPTTAAPAHEITATAPPSTASRGPESAAESNSTHLPGHESAATAPSAHESVTTSPANSTAPLPAAP